LQLSIRATIRDGSAALPTLGEEVLIAAIGQRYLTSILKGQGMESTSIVLTASQISGGGQSFDLRGNKQASRFLADVSSLSSIGFAKSSNLWWCILGLLGGILGLGLLYVGRLMIAPGLGIGCVGIVFLIKFFLSSKAILMLNISGHIEAISVSGVPKDELEAFLSDSMKWLAQRSRHLSGASSIDVIK
jgi:hypothetical protein